MSAACKASILKSIHDLLNEMGYPQYANASHIAISTIPSIIKKREYPYIVTISEEGSPRAEEVWKRLKQKGLECALWPSQINPEFQCIVVSGYIFVY